MNETRQIQSMIDFIEREAQEKADEVDAAAQEDYDIEKMRLVEAEKTKIRSDTEKKKKQVEVNRRVARAKYSKMQRLRVMAARAEIMEELHERTRKNIMSMRTNPEEQRRLLSNLLKQSALTIQADASVRCCREDQSDVSQLLPEIARWYKDKTDKPITLRLDTDYLDTNEAWGGVVLVSLDGRIMCNNTLSYRTTTCFEQQLPIVRYYLFNKDAPV